MPSDSYMVNYIYTYIHTHICVCVFICMYICNFHFLLLEGPTEANMYRAQGNFIGPRHGVGRHLNGGLKTKVIHSWALVTT